MKYFAYRSIIRRFLHIALMLCASVTIHAYDFKVDGVCYNILSDTEHTVEVTYEAVNSPYVGDVVIPVSVMNNGVSYKVVQIGDYAMVNIAEISGRPNGWNNNTLLKSVTIQANIESIGNHAFAGCTSLTTLSLPAIRRIGQAAFLECRGLTAITIPNSVTTIGYSAFADCSGLTSIVVDAANTKYDSRDNCNAIIETSTNKIIVGCKNTVIPNSVTTIGFSSFFRCSGLTAITIPNSVTTIETNAFYLCSSLTSITIPNSVTSIGGGAFSRCSGLTSVIIPNSVTSIGINAFSSCI